VAWNVLYPAAKSRIERQIDVCVFERGRDRPALIIEAKRHKRPVDLVHAGSTFALVHDVGGIPAVMVTSSGFSTAAGTFLAAVSIDHLTITLDEARGLSWIPIIERAFALDNEFREVSGHLVQALRCGDAEPFLDETGLPYEEWLAVMKTAIGLFPKSVTRFLFGLARYHYDDAVRFNAIQLLDDAGYLTSKRISTLLRTERDPENVELLQMLRSE
jgi:hypothetical protein